MSADVGSSEYGALSVNLQAVAIPRTLFRVSPGSFLPPPKVESAVVRVDPRPDPVVAESEEEPLRRLVIDAFGMRRKQMRRVLRSLWNASADQADAVLEQAKVDPTARPEVLSPEDFARVLRARSIVSSS